VRQRPEWWEWELEFTSHLLKRMLDRMFTEIELRTMLDQAASWQPDVEPGRWAVATRYRRRSWEVIVEPDSESKVLVVVTAYPVDGE